jgi:hypothetical protein
MPRCPATKIFSARSFMSPVLALIQCRSLTRQAPIADGAGIGSTGPRVPT